MNKQLLTATLVTISSLACANHEMPNYDFLPIDQLQYCQQNNTELCKELAALFVTARELMTEDQLKKADELHAALAQEIAAKQEVGIKNQNTEENKSPNLTQDDSNNEGLAEKLNLEATE